MALFVEVARAGIDSTSAKSCELSVYASIHSSVRIEE